MILCLRGVCVCTLTPHMGTWGERGASVRVHGPGNEDEHVGVCTADAPQCVRMHACVPVRVKGLELHFWSLLSMGPTKPRVVTAPSILATQARQEPLPARGYRTARALLSEFPDRSFNGALFIYQGLLGSLGMSTGWREAGLQTPPTAAEQRQGALNCLMPHLKELRPGWFIYWEKEGERDRQTDSHEWIEGVVPLQQVQVPRRPSEWS